MSKIWGKKGAISYAIQGEDGPISVFVGGEIEDFPLLERAKIAWREKKRNKIEKTITANPHTLKEVAEYLQEKYGAVEVAEQSEEYAEQRTSVKESIIIQHKPELLEGLEEIEVPKELTEEALKDLWKQAELRRAKAESISDEMVPMDFHMYKIKTSEEGEIEFVIENTWEIFSTSYSGSKKELKFMKKVAQEAQLFYGVTEDDIKKRTRRYKDLLAMLCD